MKESFVQSMLRYQRIVEDQSPHKKLSVSTIKLLKDYLDKPDLRHYIKPCINETPDFYGFVKYCQIKYLSHTDYQNTIDFELLNTFPLTNDNLKKYIDSYNITQEDQEEYEIITTTIEDRLKNQLNQNTTLQQGVPISTFDHEGNTTLSISGYQKGYFRYMIDQILELTSEEKNYVYGSNIAHIYLKLLGKKNIAIHIQKGNENYASTKIFTNDFDTVEFLKKVTPRELPLYEAIRI